MFTTAGLRRRSSSCAARSAPTHAIDYREEDFVEVLGEAGGADVILDNMGAKYLGRNVDRARHRRAAS